jgi:hypothetical protein
MPRSQRYRRLIALAALSLAAVAVTAGVLLCRPRPPADLGSWDEARLAAELRAMGYHVHVEPKDREGAPGPNGHPRAVLAGVYACRDEPASWDEVASRPRGVASRWPGCAVAVRGKYAVPGRSDYLTAGPWLLYGDPEELDRIAWALGFR